MNTQVDQINNFNWYVLTVRNRKEKIICEKIKAVIDQEGLDDYFKDFLIPTEKVIEIVKERKREVERLFFPGYIFIHMAFTPETWRLVKSVDGVAGFISSKKNEPRVMSQSEVAKVMSRMEQAQKSAPRMKSEFRAGDTVRITDGPFNDFSGTVEEVNLQRNKVIVAVAVFGRNTPVELQFNQIEKEI